MKNWTELENSSFFDANARERALGMVDKGTFTEFLNPLDRYCSPHLPVLGTAVEFDDGTVCGVGLLGKHPVFVVSMEGKFIGGAIGEVNGGKMVATIRLALKAAADIKAKYPEEYAARRPLVAVSFETGGVSSPPPTASWKWKAWTAPSTARSSPSRMAPRAWWRASSRAVRASCSSTALRPLASAPWSPAAARRVLRYAADI